MSDISLDERRRLVQAAITQSYGSDLYVCDLFDDRAIYEKYVEGGDAGKSFEVPYTLDEESREVTLGERAEVVRETTYRRAAVKFVGKDTIEGLAIPYGVDTDGETFTSDTDLCIDWFGDSGRPLLYNHGLDRAHKASKVGRQIEFETRDEGIWAQSQIEANARYRKAIDRLIEEGALGYSSGAYQHLATKNRKGEITRWPWIELSLTPFPAHPAALGVHYVKSASFIDFFDDEVPAPLKAALSALDQWAESNSDADSLPDGLKVADLFDRLSVDGPAWVKARRDWYAKSGRVLSAVTRERLAAHPNALRQLADDLDELLTTADAEKAPAKSTTDLRLAALSKGLIDIDMALERTH